MTSPIRSALLSLALLALQPSGHANPVQEHPGYWLGEMTTPGGQLLHIGAELFVRADGSAWASVASPDQGAYDIPVKAIVTESRDAFVLDIGIASLQLAWDKDHFRGEWRQGRPPVKLELRQVGAFPMQARPQAPRPPFPYKEEPLAIASRDGVTLGATLTVPHAPARPNVVVLIAGSGPQTRHVDMFGHHMFDVLADYLARQGVAVLRYDKRGIGRSTGDYFGHTLSGLEDDAYAAVEALAARRQFGHIGLVGHSEGAAIAGAVAARHPEAVGFVVSLGGVGMSGLDLMLLQDRQWASDHGAGSAEVARLMPYVRKYYETVLATPDGEPRIAALQALHAGLPKQEQDLIAKYHMNEVTLDPAVAAQPFLPVSLKTDTRRDWSIVRCPVLVLGGGLDHQVPAEANVAGIVAALRAGKNIRVESAVLPSLNHAFQTARTGNPDEYAQITETMAPAVLRKVADFARRQ